MMKSIEEMQAKSKEGFEAYVASASALTKGMTAMAQEATDFSKKSFEKSREVAEQAAATKSFDKAFEVQQGFAKEAYESFLAQATKMNELYVATAKEAYKPFEATMTAFGFKPQQ